MASSPLWTNNEPATVHLWWTTTLWNLVLEDIGSAIIEGAWLQLLQVILILFYYEFYVALTGNTNIVLV